MQLVQSDYEKRLKDVEHREAKLLTEMEARENGLLVKNKNLVDDVRILQQQLKNLENIHQGDVDNSSKLSRNLERYKSIEKNLREDVKELRKTVAELSDDKERLGSQVKQLTEQAEQFSGVQNNYASLYEANTSLKAECEELQGRLEATIVEKEELEKLNQDITDALNEERESKEVLEIKLREGSYQLPRVSWEEEEGQAWIKENTSIDEEAVAPTSVNFSSTPIPNGPTTSSLFSEIQSTDKTAELDELKEAIDLAKEKITSLLEERTTLEEKISSLTAIEEGREQTDGSKNLDTVAEKEKTIQELREEIDNKNELLERLHQRVKIDGTEKTALEIKIETLSNELQNVRENLQNIVEMKDKEISKLDEALQEVHEHKVVLEGDLDVVRTKLDQLESVMANSHNELFTLVGQLKNLKKAVETLQNDDQPNNSQGQPDLVPKSDPDSAVSKISSLKIKSHKVIEIDEEKQCFTVVTVFKELLQSLRVPIDRYTRIMLSRSLHNSGKDSEVVSNSLILAEKNAEIAKLKNRIAHKTDELNNLRSIMKARQTTADVGYKTLQSQLESERAKLSREICQLKYEIKELQKTNAELENFKSIYLHRFEDLLNQMSELKRKLEMATMREEETNKLLEKTIQRKLELTQALEEYEIKNEVLYIIPQRMESSRI